MLTANTKANKKIRKLVIKIGRHLFSSNLDSKKILAYSELFQKLQQNGFRIVVVTGGGEEARRYITVARELGVSEFICDSLGIRVSRLNAYLLIAGIGDAAYPEPPSTLENLRKAFESEKIVVMGGLQAGQSTNAVAALAAEAIGANLLVNATNIDGVYTIDPKKDPNAKRYKIIKSKELLKLVLESKLLAGKYELFDPIAIKIVERSRIPTRIIDGTKIDNIELVVKGKPLGTLIEFS